MVKVTIHQPSQSSIITIINHHNHQPSQSSTIKISNHQPSQSSTIAIIVYCSGKELPMTARKPGIQRHKRKPELGR
jgi:hypothetical protein